MADKSTPQCVYAVGQVPTDKESRVSKWVTPMSSLCCHLPPFITTMPHSRSWSFRDNCRRPRADTHNTVMYVHTYVHTYICVRVRMHKQFKCFSIHPTLNKLLYHKLSALMSNNIHPIYYTKVSVITMLMYIDRYTHTHTRAHTHTHTHMHTERNTHL